MGVIFNSFNQVSQARSEGRDILVVDLSEVTQHHDLRISPTRLMIDFN